MRLARVIASAGAQAVRARRGWRPRKVYLKELLQAVAVADRIEAAGDVAHLHAHFAHGATTVTWWAARLCERPFSFTGHAKDIYRESLNPAGLLRRKMRAASFVVTCTGANLEHLRALGTQTPVHLVYHGLNPDFARLAAGAVPVAEPPRFRIVSVGRMVDKKGFDVLVEAVAAAAPARRRRRARDRRRGRPGRRRPSTRWSPREASVPSPRARGPLDQPGLLALLAGAGVFALACRVAADGDRDGIPNVLVEAMAAGVPVVSTAVSGIPELVSDGVNGLLVAPEDPDALAAALQRLATDDALRRRLGGAGRAPWPSASTATCWPASWPR